ATATASPRRPRRTCPRSGSAPQRDLRPRRGGERRTGHRGAAARTAHAPGVVLRRVSEPNYPLTPPTVSPPTMYFCSDRYTTETGSATMIAIAENLDHGVLPAYC